MTDPPANITCVYHDVSTGRGDFHVQADGKMHIFYSSTGAQCDGRLIIAEAAGSSKTKPVYISLNGVNMYRQKSPLAISDHAYAQVWLNFRNLGGHQGDSTLSGGSDSAFNTDYYGYAGLRVAENARFALRATDELCYQQSYKLTVRGGVGAAGIGGHQNDNVCSGGSWLDIDVSTNFYKLYVYGGTGGAAIGAGQDGWCDRVYISRGYIFAKGGKGGAGIGSGRDIGAGIGGECNGVTITGGHIEAEGGENAAGIGGGRDGNANAIWILGKTTYVKATGISGGAGIGGGDDGDGSNIVIKGTSAGGPMVYAYSSDSAAAIGGGDASKASNITLQYCNVTALARGSGAGIGGGGTFSLDLTAGAENILIEHAAVTAQSFGHGAGIGGGYAALSAYQVEYITIRNSRVSALSKGCGAGIGGGTHAPASHIIIENSTVDAQSNGDGQSYNPVYNGGAGIGSGSPTTLIRDTFDIRIKNSTITGNGIGGGSAPLERALATAMSSARDITIENSNVNVKGNYGCAGIGGGASGEGNSIVITGSKVRAEGGGGGASGIGGGAPILLTPMINCNGITITDSDVQAFSGGGAGAGIGAGGSGEGNGILLDGGNIFAAADYSGNPASHGGAVGNGCNANVILPGVTPEGMVTIEDGTMYFADLCSRDDDFPGHMEINGGSINIEHVDGAVMNSAKTRVYKTTVTLPGGPADAGKKVTNLSLNGYTYNKDAIWADDQGKIYLWLPQKTGQTATLSVEGYTGDGFNYSGDVKIDNTGVLTLDRPLITPMLGVICDNKVYDGIPVNASVTTDLPADLRAQITYAFKKCVTNTTIYEPIDGAPKDPGSYNVTASFTGNNTYAAVSDTAFFTISPANADTDFRIVCPSKAFDGTPVSPAVTKKPAGYEGDTVFNYEFRTWDGAQWSAISTVAPSAVGNYLVRAITTDGQRISNEVAFHIYQDAPVFAVTIELKLNNIPYWSRVMSLRSGDGTTYALEDVTGTGKYTNATVLNGVYAVYLDGVAIDKTITVSGADVTETVAYYEISFDSKDGTPAPDVQTVLKGGLVSEPPLMKKAGYAFTGWYGSGNDQWEFASDTVLTKKTLTAGWDATLAYVQVSPANAVFPEKTLDYYASPAAATFTIVNRGGADITAFSVSSSAADSAFILQYASGTIAANDGTATFTVQPKMGLELGTYTETISVTTVPASTAALTVSVSFSVAKRVIKIAADPASVNFGTVKEGYPVPPAALPFMVKYTGNFYALVKKPVSENYDVFGDTLTLLSSTNQTATFTLRPKASRPVGTYNETIAVNTAFGAAETSFAAQFAVAVGPDAATIVRNPESVTVSVGSEATFSVTAIGNPTPDYLWQVNNGVGWVTIPGATGTSYTIADTLTAMPNSQYRCIAHNIISGESIVAVSQPATLMLTLPMALLPRDSFTAGKAENLTLKAGDNQNIRFSNAFAAVTLGGELLQEGVAFDGEDGSILLHFKKDYLNTLLPGQYMLRLSLTNGVTQELPLFVVSTEDGASVPETGDNNKTLLWLGIVFFSGTAFAIVRVWRAWLARKARRVDKECESRHE